MNHRMRCFIILVSLCQSYCTLTNHEFQANDATQLNCTPIMPESEKCPSDWSIIDDPPLCLYHSLGPRNFTESFKYCQSLGDDVDMVVTLTQDMGKAVMKSFQESSLLKVWIGLNDLDGDKKWTWSDDKFNLSNGMRSVENSRFVYHEYKPAERKYPCAHFDTDRTLKWKSGNCSSSNSVICQMRTQNGKCKQNWIKQNDKFCFKPQGKTKSSFLSSRKLCNSQDAFLLYIPTLADSDYWRRDYFPALSTTWIGVDRVENGDDTMRDENRNYRYLWKWTKTGKLIPLNKYNRYKYPTYESTACSSLNGIGTWKDEYCTDKLPVTCMRQLAKSPANTSLKLKYHHPDKVFYAGMSVIATCTFIEIDPNTPRWTVVNDSSVISIERNAFSVSTERLRSDEGFCISRVTSTLVLRDWGLIQNATISCFATSIARLSLPSGCTDISKALTTCDAKVFSVVAGPTGRPDLQLKHDGRDIDKNIRNVYTLEAGKRNIVSCTVPTGQDGTLQWALSLKNETRILDHDDKRIVSYKINEPKQEITSDVTLRLQLSESGIIVSCFGYDAKYYHNGKLMPCRDDDLFCTKLQIEVYSDPDPEVAGYQWLSYPNLGFFIGLIAIFAIWFTFFRTAKSLSIHQGEDEPLPRTSEPQNPHDAQPPVEEVLEEN